MMKVQLILAAATALTSLFAAMTAHARDATRQPVPPTQAVPYAIPNPYAAPAPAAPSTGSRAGDAYATGFAIGLGTALINKQREDEMKRLHEQGAARR